MSTLLREATIVEGGGCECNEQTEGVSAISLLSEARLASAEAAHV